MGRDMDRLKEAVKDLKIYVGNPSAWDNYSEEGSEKIRKLVNIVEGAEEDKPGDFSWMKGHKKTSSSDFYYVDKKGINTYEIGYSDNGDGFFLAEMKVNDRFKSFPHALVSLLNAVFEDEKIIELLSESEKVDEYDLEVGSWYMDDENWLCYAHNVGMAYRIDGKEQKERRRGARVKFVPPSEVVNYLG